MFMSFELCRKAKFWIVTAAIAWGIVVGTVSYLEACDDGENPCPQGFICCTECGCCLDLDYEF